jgi:hypothetical protein
MTLLVLFGLGLFVVFMLGFVLLMGRSSSEGALLEQLAQAARSTGPVAGPWRPSLSSESVAKPFTAFRRFFASEPDPEIVRELCLPGISSRIMPTSSWG